jgi:aminoglycoside 2'-N-acetyltransferase I
VVRQEAPGVVSAPTVVTRAHTAELSPADLDAARALVERAFVHLPPEDAFGDDDWEHALGGQHVLVHEGGALVAHGALVMRRLLHGGRALRAGYVEAVAVAPGRQRAGLGGRVMAALEDLAPAYDLLALGATDEGMGLYERRGWVRWRGRLSTMTPHDGIHPLPEAEGWVYVLPGATPLDLDGELTCDWRDGDVW